MCFDDALNGVKGFSSLSVFAESALAFGDMAIDVRAAL